MTETQLRDKMGELIKGSPCKIWLTRVSGHRLDFVWSVGPAQTAAEEGLSRIGDYYLVGQRVPPEMRAPVIDLFEEFCSGEHIKDGAIVDRRLRISRAG